MRLRCSTHFFEYITEDAILPGLLASNIFKSTIKFIYVDTLGVDDFSFNRLKFAVFLGNICVSLLFIKKI